MDDNADAGLQVSLAIRHRLAVLADLAREITLVALNAKVSSAQLGSTGAAFSVMTQEIQLIASSLRNTVDDVRHLTKEWTKLSAKIATANNQRQQFIRANRNGSHFTPALARVTRELITLEKQTPRMITRLIDIVDDMERSLRVVNYVTVGILMESERIGHAGIQGQSQQPFEVLAQEMRDASEQIRSLATYSVQQMQRIQGQAA